MSKEDLIQKYNDKIAEFVLLVRDPFSLDEDVRSRIKIINTYIQYFKLDEDVPFLDEESVFNIRQEIKPFYARLMNEITTEEELKEEYYELSEEVQDTYWLSDVLNDWEERQRSKGTHEYYLSVLDKPFFSEEELKEAYDLSVGRSLYRDDNRMQVLSWPEFRKQHEKRIMGTNYYVGSVNFKLAPCEIKKGKWFFMGQTEVTQELFQAVMLWNNSYEKSSSQNPVETVTWYDCISFCNELSKLLGLEECYKISDVETDRVHITKATVKWDESKNGFRLPTEKEWELCAKAGTNNKYSGTNDTTSLGRYAWYRKNAKKRVQPVGKKKPNGWGLYDMSGNVGEWCWDLHYPKDAETGARVVRGGNVLNGDLFCECTMRDKSDAKSRHFTLGFRLCRSFG